MMKPPTVYAATKPSVIGSPTACRISSDSVIDVARDSTTATMPSQRSRRRAPACSRILSSTASSASCHFANRRSDNDSQVARAARAMLDSTP